MNILYIANIRLPTEKAHGAQIMKTCEAFAQNGVDVELVVPGRKTHIQEDPFSYYDVKRCFIITERKVPDLIRFGRVGFIISALWFSEEVKRYTGFKNADIIYSRDASVLLRYLLLGRKLVYEAHTRPTVISKFVAQRVYKVVAISQGLKDAYVRAGVKERDITIAPDAVDVQAFENEYSQVESRDWLGIPRDKKVALYVGRIDGAKGADTFAAASEHLPEDIQCVLIGSGSIKEQLQKKYEKALFLPETPYRKLPQVLASADVLVIPNSGRDVNAARYTSPMKLFAYMASGIPVVAADLPALKEAVNENIAYFFTPDNPKDLVLVIRKSISKPSESSQKALMAKKEAEKHSWISRSKSVLDFLDKKFI